ncbi:MAG: heme-binding protein [Prosthecobacter sp.]
MKRMLWVIPGLVLLGVSFFFVSNSRAATETAPYKVVRKDGSFELREYDTLHLAKVSMPTSDKRSKNMDGGFMKLFRFIDGQNERDEKISMTTPVIVERGEKESSMSFVMPQKSVAKGLPVPKGEVKLDQIPAVKVVALRFSGVSNSTKEAAQLAVLQAWAAKESIMVEGTPLFAFYDPPWTLGFMRRNEVLLRVKAK